MSEHLNPGTDTVVLERLYAACERSGAPEDLLERISLLGRAVRAWQGLEVTRHRVEAGDRITHLMFDQTRCASAIVDYVTGDGCEVTDGGISYLIPWHQVIGWRPAEAGQ